jgi:hypothetical protein
VVVLPRTKKCGNYMQWLLRMFNNICRLYRKSFRQKILRLCTLQLMTTCPRSVQNQQQAADPLPLSREQRLRLRLEIARDLSRLRAEIARINALPHHVRVDENLDAILVQYNALVRLRSLLQLPRPFCLRFTLP